VTPCSIHLKNQPVHYLDTTYVTWLYEKTLTNTNGSYLLKGFNEDLDSVFEMPLNPSKPDSGNAVQVHSATLPVKHAKTYNIPETSPAKVIVGSSTDSSQILTGHVFNRLEITNPIDGDRFVLHPEYPDQAIQLSIMLQQPVDNITWFVDGMEYSKSAPPYEVFWTVEKGQHTITAVASGIHADSVTIMVD